MSNMHFEVYNIEKELQRLRSYSKINQDIRSDILQFRLVPIAFLNSQHSPCTVQGRMLIGIYSCLHVRHNHNCDISENATDELIMNQSIRIISYWLEEWLEEMFRRNRKEILPGGQCQVNVVIGCFDLGKQTRNHPNSSEAPAAQLSS
ncbi:hypothetical protein VNO77_25428 [Canavalia gladiata]|uniref:Uncharacterized protein n=1 Tax=Canavalia gladiata TaxID=3824 RepID=A0AAN9L836_CANGL